jgi:hypothetical protein
MKNPCKDILLSDILPSRMPGVQPMPPPTGIIFTMRYINQDPNIAKFHKKYRFSRAKWHEATISFKDGPAIWEWCTERFGKQDKNPDAWSRWYIAINTIRFRDEKDYIMFVLRWS